MKKSILSLGFVICAFVAANAQSTTITPAVTPAATTVDNPNAPDIKFETELVDYGTIEHNADGNREFKFKNTGKEPLIITNCQGSCGCTVPTWPKEPIKPGGTAAIKVHYATDRVGAFEKTVTVNSNAKTPVKVIKIKGVVKPDPAAATAPTATPAANPTATPVATPH
jgi:hypothetical protein